MLYLSPIWALRYLDKLEITQVEFYKRLLNLPRCTSSSALRLDLNLDKLEIKVISATVNWIIKILEMDDSRYPKVCLVR